MSVSYLIFRIQCSTSLKAKSKSRIHKFRYLSINSAIPIYDASAAMNIFDDSDDSIEVLLAHLCAGRQA